MRPPLFLPDGYLENPPNSADADGTPFWCDAPDDLDLRWQIPVYRFAARRFAHAKATVLDVGCGTGHKVQRHFLRIVGRTVGIDQPSAIEHARRHFPHLEWIEGDLRADATWDRAAGVGPDLVICADVIEHVSDPVQLLDRLLQVIGQRGRLVLSTPDRERLEGARRLGPPQNRRHIREWSANELQALVGSRGFAVIRQRHFLPRSYALSRLEFKRMAWRALHGLAVPSPRSCVAVVLCAAPGN